MSSNVIKFLDLKKSFSEFQHEYLSEMKRVCSSGNFILGDEVEDFEIKFSKMCSSDFCIAVGSGLDALKLTLTAWIFLGKLSPGDEVIVPSNTFIASVLAIIDSGLVPKFVDPDAITFNLDPNLVERNISRKTKVIMAVHLYGSLCALELKKIADKYNLLLLEDAAQAHFASSGNLCAGNIGDAAAFSFYPGKNLGAFGDGGAITTSNQELAVILRKLRNYGNKRKYENEYRGFNSRLDPLQAAILKIKLKYVHQQNERRRQIAERYHLELHERNLQLPKCKTHNINSDLSHVWHLFVIKVEERGNMIKHLDECGVETLIHYPIPPHKQQALIEFSRAELPVADKLSQQVLSIPLNPWMTDGDVDHVIQSVNSYSRPR